jgi:hypothetical protein
MPLPEVQGSLISHPSRFWSDAILSSVCRTSCLDELSILSFAPSVQQSVHCLGAVERPLLSMDQCGRLWPVRDDHRADLSGRWMKHSSHAGLKGRCRLSSRHSSPWFV